MNNKRKLSINPIGDLKVYDNAGENVYEGKVITEKQFDENKQLTTMTFHTENNAELIEIIKNK
ncbi:hypothetical protein [Metabacillus fastidiosus]|uniref:hypothetical protein n=1 Tax=Metabacillus fastidiosus TaxID=1458 RepID=UPI003D265C91